MYLSDSHLDRLLAGRDRLSVTEKEQILERVMAQTKGAAPEHRSPRLVLRWAFALGAVAALVPVALLVWNGRSQPEFTARGGAQVAPGVEVVCLDRGGHAGECRQGGRLFFRLSPGRFSAFAAVSLAPDGKTFWYFPSDDHGTGVDLAAQKRAGLLDQAIVLDDRHSPGDHDLYAVFSQRPLTKEQVRQAIQNPGALGAVVVQRRIHLAERGAP